MPVVMVPLDGSSAAEAALPWATHLAKRTGGEVRLVGVHAPPAVLLDGETLGTVIPDEPVRQREVDYFAGVQGRVKATGVPVSADLLDGGVVTSLAEYAASLRPTWIVMLSHARGTVGRFLFGETATEFVPRSPCPVLLVHDGDSPDVHHVLVPLDGSPLAEGIVRPAAEFARVVAADITLLVAQADARHPDPAGYLAKQAELLRTSGLNAETRVVSEGHAADAIVAAADARAGTVVALATHGRGGLSKLVWGSVTDQVVHRTRRPVLVFKPLED
jgi:nucleotide-binding universal stress UspA family protein